jgi:hypothetical protein
LPGFFGAPDVAGPLCGLALAGPLFPELLVEQLPAVADPVFPVLPDWVMPVVLAFPDSAPEVEFDVVLTEPDRPPLPESPEVATGLEVALPVSVEPVEPVFPEVALLEPLPEGPWPFLLGFWPFWPPPHDGGPWFPQTATGLPQVAQGLLPLP